MKVYNEYNYKNLREIVVTTIDNIIGNENFLDMVDEFSSIDEYDFIKSIDEEFYTINRKTGEYINWYKYTHIGRCVNMNFHPRRLISFFRELKSSWSEIKRRIK